MIVLTEPNLSIAEIELAPEHYQFLLAVVHLMYAALISVEHSRQNLGYLRGEYGDQTLQLSKQDLLSPFERERIQLSQSRRPT